MPPLSRRFALLALAAVSIAACNRRPAAETPAPAPAASDDAERAAREAAARDEAARREREEAERLARESAARDAAARMRAAIVAPIYFGFDLSDLDADARRILDGKLEALNGDPALALRIVGHTDERGSDEYNVALGMRRAAAARRYLVQRGVSEGRLDITSMGEEQPACGDASEACWSRNRRDEFEITAGGPVARRD